MRRLFKNMLLQNFPYLLKWYAVIRRKIYILFSGYVALNNLDKQLEKYCSYSDGYYVELGANDGIDQSNSFYFEKKKNWSGVLIEPSPNNYLKCRKIRSPRNKFFCNACVSFDYKEKFVEMTYANLMTISNSLKKDIDDDKKFINLSTQHLKSYEDHFIFGAQAKTLTSILIDANSPEKMDFLSLDVEGSEIEILKGFDFSRFSFKFLLIESRSLDELSNFLLPHKYFLESKFSEHDYLFKKYTNIG